ncbi:PIN domain-like protein [Pholiota molesta]|nr:PIN domain-like protein [Pholiota molesta]
MGIRGLWNVISAASQKRMLTQIAVSEGFDQQRRQERCLILGIDASIWMNQAQKAVGRGTGTRAGENSAVRVLFYRLCRLLTLPIIPVFVFDGPDRPSKKRGKRVLSAKARRKLHWLSTPFQKFIDAFGFTWYTAPGEAEADLAALSSRNIIDAILSEDSDSLLNDARCVFRMKNFKDDEVEVFTADAIKSHPQVSLDREGLFLMAILCGSDYHKTGLSGCGWKTARQLACTELAHSLFTATLSLPSRAALQNFLCEWRQSFRTLLSEDPDHVLGKKLPSLASKIDCSFPSIDVLLQYAKPLTSWTAAGCEPPDALSWKLRQPRVNDIGTLCEKYFSWGSFQEIVARLKGNLWPGIAVRHLLQVKYYAILNSF